MEFCRVGGFCGYQKGRGRGVFRPHTFLMLILESSPLPESPTGKCRVGAGAQDQWEQAVLLGRGVKSESCPRTSAPSGNRGWGLRYCPAHPILPMDSMVAMVTSLSAFPQARPSFLPEDHSPFPPKLSTSLGQDLSCYCGAHTFFF